MMGVNEHPRRSPSPASHRSFGREALDRFLRTVQRRPRPLDPIRRVARPTLRQFAAIRSEGKPVIIEGLTQEMPALAGWTLPRLKERFGDRQVAAIPTHDGRIESDVREGVPFDTVRFGEYVDQLIAGERPAHYLAAPPAEWLPELDREVEFPEYCRDAPWRNSRFWLSAAQTSVPLHCDLAENLFVQVEGRKRFFLYPPQASAWLYSNGLRSALPNYSRFDPERPDYQAFPLCHEVTPLEVILQAGDTLFLPSRWWHQVRSLDVSVSLAFWWADGALAVVVRAAEWTKRARTLEIYGLAALLT